MYKIFSKEILTRGVVLKGPYLMASRKTRLLAGPQDSLLYSLDYTPMLLSDTISGKSLGTGPFDISFTFTPEAGAGFRYLFQVPGLVEFAYDWSSGYGLLFNLEGLGWRSVGTEGAGGPIHAGENTVRLYHADADADIALEVNGVKYTLVKAWTEWVYGPEKAEKASDVSGSVSTTGWSSNGLYDSYNAWSTLRWYSLQKMISAETYGDGAHGAGPLFQNKYSAGGENAWWEWKLPQDGKYRLLSATLLSATSYRYVSENIKKTKDWLDKIYPVDGYRLRLCADTDEGSALTDYFIYDTNDIVEGRPVFVNAGQEDWVFGWAAARINITPRVVEKICLHVCNPEGKDSITSNDSQLNIGCMFFNTEKYHCPSFTTGQLQFYSKKEVKNLLLQDSYAE